MKKKDIFTVLLPAILLVTAALAMLFLPAKSYSVTERRALAQRPSFTVKAFQSGEYMEKAESAALDQFPLRDTFRSLRTVFGYYILGQKDINGYYLAEGYLSKLEYPLNYSRLERSIKKQQQLYDAYLKNTDCHVYFSLIPDKNAFLAEKNGYLSMDYGEYTQIVREGVPYAAYIDIAPTLSLESFYRTDQHWRQETLIPTAALLLGSMGRNSVENEAIPPRYEYQTLDTPFYGTYYYQSMLPAEPDEIVYLTDAMLQNCIVTSYDSGMAQRVEMYNVEKANGRDAYEFFLNGSDALITIENPAAVTNRELILFRDSFASSLAPLLMEQYSKITLVDMRYIRAELLPTYITFTNQDVLFLYSSLLF